MGTQQPSTTQKRKGLPLGQWIIIIFFIMTIVAFGIVAFVILMNQGITQGAATLTIVSIVFGSIVALLALMFAILQWLNSRDPPTTPLPPSTPPPGKPTHRDIVGGILPATNPKTIQQREKVVKKIYAKLIQPDIAAIALTGIGGSGKSTLAALVYRYAEEQRKARQGPFEAEPTWHTINSTHTMADLAGTLLEALGKPLPDLSSLSPENQAVALFKVLNTVDSPRLVILDQFENLLGWETGHALPNRPGVGEWLDVLNSQPCRCRVLLTSRPVPQGTRADPPTCLQAYCVEGLEVAEGVELLRKQGVQGTEAELRSAVERCNGHALSLTLLALLLRKRNLNLSTLLKDSAYTQLWAGDIARNLLDSIYTQQLDQLERTLLAAFSVFREPVLLDAAQAIIDGTLKISKTQLETTLDALLAQHLLQAVGEGHYQLHTIVASYAQSHFAEGDEQAIQQALQAAHARAAQYYQQRAATSCPQREQRRQISDVHDLVEAIWQYCQAKQWQEAYDLMEREGIYEDLNRWGSNAILLELYLLLIPDKWHPERSQAACIYYSLGWIYSELGKMKEALTYYKQALRIRREVGDRKGEGDVLGNLGHVYKDLGQKQKALEYYEQALDIYKEVRDRKEEGNALLSLGQVYNDLGQQQKALEYYEQALDIYKEVGYRMGEGVAFDSLGRVYNDLGQQQKALEYYEQALDIYKEVRAHKDEGNALLSLGRVYNDLGQQQRALEYYEQALDIYKEVGYRVGEGVAFYYLGQVYNALGQQQKALEYSEQALDIHKEVGYRVGEGNALLRLGQIYNALSQQQKALEYSEQALRIFQEIRARKEEGTTLGNVGTLYFKQGRYDVALACFLLARDIFHEVQSPDRDKVQEGIDDLHKRVGEKRFAGLLAQVEPRAHEIVKGALGEDTAEEK